MCNCTVYPKGNCYYHVWLIITRVIVVISFALLRFVIKFDYVQISNTLENILDTNFISDIQLIDSGKCPETLYQVALSTWGGISKGCACSDGKIYEGTCPQSGCVQINEADPVIMSNWEGKTFCVNLDKLASYRTYLKEKVISPGEECGEKKKQCGYVDRLGHILCLDINERCPINYLEISNTADVPSNYKGTEEPTSLALNNGKYLFLSNSNIWGFLIHTLVAGEGQVCSNYTEYYSRYEPYKLEKTTFCNNDSGNVRYDNSFIRIDTINKYDYFTDNSVTTITDTIEGYPLNENSLDTISLYKGVLSGLEMSCVKKGPLSKLDAPYIKNDLLMYLILFILACIAILLSILILIPYFKSYEKCYYINLGVMFIIDLAIVLVVFIIFIFTWLSIIPSSCGNLHIVEQINDEYFNLKIRLILLGIIFVFSLIPFGSFFCGECCSEGETDQDIDTLENIIDVNIHSNRVLCLLCLKDGRIVAGSEDKSISVSSLDLKRKILEQSIIEKNAHTDAIYSLCEVGGNLVSGGKDAQVKVWVINERNVELIKTYSHSESVTKVMSLNKNNFVSCSLDGNVMFWDISKSTYTKKIEEIGEITSVLILNQNNNILITQYLDSTANTHSNLYDSEIHLGFWNIKKKTKMNSLQTGGNKNNSLIELSNGLICVAQHGSRVISLVDPIKIEIIKIIQDKMGFYNSAVLCNYSEDTFVSFSNGYISQFSIISGYKIVYFGDYRETTERDEEYTTAITFQGKYIIVNNNTCGYSVYRSIWERAK